MMADAEPVQVTMRFNANAVAAPAQRAARQADEIVTFSLNSIEAADLTQKPTSRVVNFFHAKFSGPDQTEAERKTEYTNWILVRGFLELARGTKASLEEAMLFIEASKMVGRRMTVGEFNGEIEAARKRANKRNFEQLLKMVNEGLREPTSFDAEFTSMQKVRNILEHRNGIVGVQDMNGKETLDLVLPRIGVFLAVDGEHVEVQQSKQFVKKDTEILIKRASRTKQFVLGDRITFTAAEFNEMAFACHLFAVDLAAKLPEVTVNSSVLNANASQNKNLSR